MISTFWVSLNLPFFSSTRFINNDLADELIAIARNNGAKTAKKASYPILKYNNLPLRDMKTEAIRGSNISLYISLALHEQIKFFTLIAFI